MIFHKWSKNIFMGQVTYFKRLVTIFIFKNFVYRIEPSNNAGQQSFCNNKLLGYPKGRVTHENNFRLFYSTICEKKLAINRPMFQKFFNQRLLNIGGIFKASADPTKGGRGYIGVDCLKITNIFANNDLTICLIFALFRHWFST